uniref:[histone H3]-lysine(4) N-trimethyltransferase n=1 Tax=Cyprinus carpio TaxID=7962 RepID=A0A8C1ZAL5_CYPCA
MQHRKGYESFEIKCIYSADVNSVSFILNRGESMSRCSQCKTAQYCSVQCQKQAWSDHKRECKMPQAPPATDPHRLVRLRIIFKLLSQSERDQEELYSIAEHQSHKYMSEEKKEGLRHLCTTLQVYLGEENHDLSQLPRPRQPPRLSISDGELQDVGVGLYPSAADCNTPCLLMFQATFLILATVVFIIHFSLFLQSLFHFLIVSLTVYSKGWEELLQESQSLLHKYADVVPDRNVYVLRLLDLAMDTCICLDDFETVLEYSNRALESYKLIYSDPHPSRAVELLRLGKLQHYLSRLDEAQGSFTQAYDIMKVTHRMDRTLTNEVRRKLSECQAELGRV